MNLRVTMENPGIQPETVFSIGSFPVTNAMIMGTIVTVLLLVIALSIKKQPKKAPSKFAIVMEMIVESFITLLEQITSSKQRALKLLPLIGALFLFIGLSNLITLIPGISSFSYGDVPLFRTPTNDFNVTFSIALAMVILTQIVSLKQFGVFGHLGKYFKFKEVIAGFREGIGAGFIAIIDFLVGLLDIISEIAKVVSLSLRLFGNMYAGEVLTAVLFGALAILVPTPWLAMNLLVGVLQAMVFGALTAAYYMLAVETQEAEVA